MGEAQHPTTHDCFYGLQQNSLELKKRLRRDPLLEVGDVLWDHLRGIIQTKVPWT